MKSTIVKLGVVGVDSGQIMICDPCYIQSEFISKEEVDFDENPAIYRHREDGSRWQFTFGTPPFKDNAVASTSGLGDGQYDVFAEIIEVEGWGERVKKVWVEFIRETELEVDQP